MSLTTPQRYGVLLLSAIAVSVCLTYTNTPVKPTPAAAAPLNKPSEAPVPTPQPTPLQKSEEEKKPASEPETAAPTIAQELPSVAKDKEEEKNVSAGQEEEEEEAPAPQKEEEEEEAAAPQKEEEQEAPVPQMEEEESAVPPPQEKEEEAPAPQMEEEEEVFTKTFELQSGSAEGELVLVEVDFFVLKLDASYFCWAGVGDVPNLESIVVAMGGGNSSSTPLTSGVWGALNQEDIGSAMRLARKTARVIHFSSALGALEQQHPELRMLVEKELVQRIL